MQGSGQYTTVSRSLLTTTPTLQEFCFIGLYSLFVNVDYCSRGGPPFCGLVHTVLNGWGYGLGDFESVGKGFSLSIR